MSLATERRRRRNPSKNETLVDFIARQRKPRLLGRHSPTTASSRALKRRSLRGKLASLVGRLFHRKGGRASVSGTGPIKGAVLAGWGRLAEHPWGQGPIRGPMREGTCVRRTLRGTLPQEFGEEGTFEGSNPPRSKRLMHSPPPPLSPCLRQPRSTHPFFPLPTVVADSTRNPLRSPSLPRSSSFIPVAIQIDRAPFLRAYRRTR